jgi:hypothetical protein
MRYLGAFDHANASSGAAPLPCPVYFVRGAKGHLQVLPTDGPTGVARSDDVGAKFEFLNN